MEVTDVRIHLNSKKKSRVKAFASITFDNSFVVRGIRVMEGDNGLFLAMPSEELRKPCPQCSSWIPVNSRFCPKCGAHLGENVSTTPRYASRDIAHPINQETREYITSKVVDAYNQAASETSSAPEEQPSE